jgi:hypothetical protein
MGLLEKRSPRATRRTVIRSSILGAVGFFAFALIMLLRTDLPVWGWVFMLSFMTVAGAVAGAAMEWQSPDGHQGEGTENDAPPDSGGM